MSTRSRKVGWMGAVVALGLGLAACSSSSTSSTTTSVAATPSSALLTAVRSSEGQPSADLTMRVNTSVNGKNVVVQGTGRVDLAANAMQLGMKFQGIPTLSGTTLSVILVDGVAYVSYPGISTVLPGKTWVSEPTTTSTSGVQLSNASDLLRVLAAKGAVITRTGSGTIGSTPVTRYSVKLNLADIAGQTSKLGISASDSEAVQQLLQNGVSVDVYIDGANQIRRLSLQLAVPATSTAPAGQESVVVDFTNYGTPVAISAPPADQIATLQQLQSVSATQSSPGEPATS